MSIRRTGIPVGVFCAAAVLAAAPALGQNINIDYDVFYGTPTPAYGAGAGQPGIWNNPAPGVTTAQALVDVLGTPTAATIRMTTAVFDLDFNNTGTSGDDQALMDDFLNLGGTTATNNFVIEHLAAGTYAVYTYAWAPDSDLFVTGVNVNGLGIQNCGGPWPGAQTLGITYTRHDDVIVPADGTITIATSTVVTFGSLNGIQLVAGATDHGRCCDLGGGCASTLEADCLPPSIFGGLGTSCFGDPCRGRCCDNSGGCELTGPADCTAPSVFGGLGSNCSGSPCMGRCCTGGNCTVAPVITCAGTATPGLLNCDAVQVFQFNDVNMVIVDNPAQTPASNIQVVETDGEVIITDLDVDMNATHTYVGDVEITLEHLGVSVIIYDRPGVVNGVCCGCSGDNFNIILDDEGTGGPIENVCSLTPPSAQSPPSYTPANPLSAFDGMPAAGEWTITSRDYFTADTGTLLSWSLHISSNAPVCPTGGCTCFGDMNGDSVVDGKDIKPFANCVAAGGAGCPCGDMNHAGGATSADVTLFVTAVLTSTCGTP